MHGEQVILLRLPKLGPVDMSITTDVALLWSSATVCFILLTLACRRKNLVPSGAMQGLFEGLIDFVDKEVIAECIGPMGRRWSGLILSLFFFILFSNLLGMVPFSRAMTSNWNVTLALAGFVFLTTLFINVKTHGLGGFLKKFAPSGVHPAILVLLVPIEIISWLAKPCSLAIRLFANMMAGHALIFAFVGLSAAATAAWKTSYLAPLPFAGAVIMSCFEVFVCFIQAFIFAMLSSLYIREALDANH